MQTKYKTETKGADAQRKEMCKQIRKEGMKPHKNNVKHNKMQEVPERTNRPLCFDTTWNAQKKITVGP
jgi:hypothetical protein